MKSDSIFCCEHKKGKIMVKITNLKRITLKKSESIFHIERLTPFTLYLKTTFSPVALLSKKSDKSDRSKVLSVLHYMFYWGSSSLFCTCIRISGKCNYLGKVCFPLFEQNSLLVSYSGFKKKQVTHRNGWTMLKT